MQLGQFSQTAEVQRQFAETNIFHSPKQQTNLSEDVQEYDLADHCSF